MVPILPYSVTPSSRWSFVKTKTRNFSLIESERVAKLLSWQQHNRCHFVSFVMKISGAKLKNTASIFPEIFLIQYFTILFANLTMSSLP